MSTSVGESKGKSSGQIIDLIIAETKVRTNHDEPIWDSNWNWKGFLPLMTAGEHRVGLKGMAAV